MSLIPQQRRLKKHLKVVTSDNEYLNDLQKRDAYLTSIKDCMESPFGVILINALEAIEGSALESLYQTNSDKETMQSKAEIKTARLLKATLMGYVYEQEVFKNALKQYAEMEQGEPEHE